MKTLGILETDTLYPDLLDDYRSYGHMFVQFFARLGLPLRYRFYQVQDGELPAHGDCDAYLITGSKAGVYDELAWIAPLQQWIRSAYAHGEKILGVCFGHQILAHSLGGFADRSEKGWGIGLHTTQLDQKPSWLPAETAEMTLIYSHQDQVKQLPPDAMRLTTSTFCEHAAFCIRDQILAFQGHPEFTADYLQRLLPRRENSIGSALLQEKLNNLSEPEDARRAGHWIAAFLQLQPQPA